MKWPSALFCLTCLFSCEKNINFQLKVAPSVLVVDASIENNQPPVVVLSKSFAYFSKINLQDLDTSFVHNAVVTISDGTQTITLKEFETDSVAGFQFFYYSADTINSTPALVGQLQTTYELKIVAAGQQYDAMTTIPPLADKMDSLWWVPTPFATDTSDVNVIVQISDPPGLGNYTRYFTKTGSGRFLPGAQSVNSDELIDGTTFNVIVPPGIDRNNPVKATKNYFHRGDTVTFKLSNIDRNTYEFWLTMEFAYQSIGNPFAAPNTVLGNISNGALGAFCGYASAFRTIHLPR